MDNDNIISGTHNITVVQRKNINITGVKRIDSFNEEEFFMDTTLGYLNIKGSVLEIVKLDTYQGDVTIKGKIDSISYTDDVKKKNKQESIFNKLFK